MVRISILGRIGRLAVIGVLSAAGVLAPMLDAAPAAGQELESQHEISCTLTTHDHTVCSQLLHGGIVTRTTAGEVSPHEAPLRLIHVVTFTRPSILRTEFPPRAPPTTRHR